MVAAGTRLGPYEVITPIGAGGMGEVYRARDTRLGRDVAVKILPATFASDPGRVRRFELEARTESAVCHPNVLTVYDVGTDGGIPYLVTELLEGETLRARLSRGPLPLEEALATAIQVAQGLEAAHSRGVLHRDLKPENLFLTRSGTVKILDFGLAKLLQDFDPRLADLSTIDARAPGGGGQPADPGTADHTVQGQIIGTVAYMSPEQARGEAVNFRSDIFSFGIVLYEMISGADPFARPTPVGTLSAIIAEAPPPLRARGRRVAREVKRILRYALAKNPGGRYPSTSHLLRDLQRAAARIERRRLVLPLALGMAALVALAVALPTTWAVRSGRTASPPAHDPVSILIADFENSTGDEVFTGALEQALQIGLEGAPFITSFNRAQARKLASQGTGGPGKLDEAAARLLSTSQGIKLVVGGSVGRRGTAYLLQVRATDPVSGAPVAAASAEAASMAEVLKAVDTVATRLRRLLGEADPSPAFALAGETFTTRSLEAMQAYARAQDAQFGGKPEVAIAEYRRAVAADRECGRAWSGLSAALANLGERDAAAEAFREASARLDGMTERERYRTRGVYYLRVRDSAKAVEEFTRLVQQYPADSAGHMNLALAHFWRRDLPKAVAQGRHATEIYPRQASGHSNLALYAMYAGDFELARREATAALELNPSYLKPSHTLALSALAEGDPGRAAEAYRKVESLGPLGKSLAAEGLADLAVYEGRLADAASLLAPAAKADLEAGRQGAAAQKTLFLAEVRLAQGPAPDALAAVETLVSGSSDETILLPAARLYLSAGREPEALALADRLAARLEPDPRAYALLVRGEAALHRRVPREAVVLLRESLQVADTWLGRFLLARAYVETEAWVEAHSELDLLLKRRGEAAALFLDEVPTFRHFPPVHLYLGRVEEALGNASASASYRTFLEIKSKADPGAPLVVEARERVSSSAASARAENPGDRPPRD